ncbi:MAG: helix-turn-helix transcriptional regulator [Desulfosalsimonadaceae bacterium]|nr:helix-turn-helix transcriptional regulator [Desulfosalsimonadaceae bacterium]
MKNQQTDAGKEKRFWIWRDELGMTGTEVAFKVGLSQSAVSRAVSWGVKPVTRQNLQLQNETYAFMHDRP